MTMRRILKVVELSHSTDFVSIREMLKTYQKGKDYVGWDNFRQKIPEDILLIWAEILRECRRNGYIAPWAYEDSIKWMQVISINNVQGDLCGLCERNCERRDDFNSGEMKKRRLADHNFVEPSPCWAKG